MDMLKSKFLCVSKRNLLRGTATIIISLSTIGCLALPPIPNAASKEIVGGDRRLNSALRIIGELRDENATRKVGVVDATYLAMFFPANTANKNIVFEEMTGLLPQWKDGVETPYIFFYPDSLDMVDTATITEILVMEPRESHLACKTFVFSWAEGHWVPKKEVIRINLPMYFQSKWEASENKCAESRLGQLKYERVPEQPEDRAAWRLEDGLWRREPGGED